MVLMNFIGELLLFLLVGFICYAWGWVSSRTDIVKILEENGIDVEKLK